MKFHHPVMIKEVSFYVQQLLETQSRPLTIFDWTLGHGGHVLNLFETLGRDIDTYVATDVDSSMFATAKERLSTTLDSDYLSHLKLYNTSYINLDKISQELEKKYDVVFLDLGVNLRHFMQHERGFSIKGDGILDMRYNQNSKSISKKDRIITASDVLNNYNELQLIDMFVVNSEISMWTSKKIAHEIVSVRSRTPFESSAQLNDLTKKLNYSARVAAIVFQALRIEINQEFQNIKKLRENCYKGMNSGGILIILSYHSWEDRIVKEYMKKMITLDQWSILTKHALSPTYKEVSGNKPSRSAKMRVFKFI